MALFFFYNNRKPRKYNYRPILYDPEKEERQERLNKRIYEIKKEMGALTPDEMKEEPTNLKGEFLGQTKHLKRRKERENSDEKSFLSNNGLLIVLLIILCALFYFWYIK